MILERSDVAQTGTAVLAALKGCKEAEAVWILKYDPAKKEAVPQGVAVVNVNQLVLAHGDRILG